VAVPFTDQVDPEEFVPVFHGWIREQTVEGALIDVARYAHVHHGPGVMLVGHEGDYSIDMAGGRPALRYTLNRDNEGTPTELVARALRRLMQAAEAVGETGKSVDTADVTVRVYDRLRAPNSHGSRQALGEPIEAAVREVLGATAIEAEPLSHDPREPLGFRIRVTAGVA
jgi:hypothetical protein